MRKVSTPTEMARTMPSIMKSQCQGERPVAFALRFFWMPYEIKPQDAPEIVAAEYNTPVVLCQHTCEHTCD